MDMKIALKKIILAVLLIILQLSISALSTPRPREIKVNDNDIIDWTVATHSRNVDGCKEREVVVVYPTYDENGKKLKPEDASFPGPTLILNKGQRVRILIRNELEGPTTVHWHGLYMKNNPYADGVPTITQCLIYSHKIFLYDFYANDIPGTHWYHAHYKPQRVDGFYGYIIIKDDDNSYIDLVEDKQNRCPYCVLISDWFHRRAEDLINQYSYCNVTNQLTPEPVPNSVLINGKGGGNCNKILMHSSIETDHIYHFERKKKYRLRILNAGALTIYYFSIDHHMLEIIEVEGMRVKSTEQVKLLPISVGQRYSVIATTNNTTTNNFWMRFQTSTDCLRPDTPQDQKELLIKEIKAIVNYNESDIKKPNTTPWGGDLHCTDLNYTLLFQANDLLKVPYPELDPKTNQPNYQNLSFKIYMTTINSTKNINKNYETYGSISLISGPQDKLLKDNNTIFGYPENTFHFTMLNLKMVEQYGSKIYKPELNAIVLDKESQHGHSFWVMEYQYDCYAEVVKFDHPIRRDTVTVPSHSRVKIRFKVGNIGVWAFHCHIEWHMEVGMLAQFVELPHKFPELPPPPNDTTVKDKAGNNVTLTTWEGLCTNPHKPIFEIPWEEIEKLCGT
ncbi:12670_t:CDS:2 [Cetraspora pellucida]|uniref:12670_t:CDS:1 n=1 Tax=Cetraspora pellucida TaxID=1433469 RepID=A0A9N9E6M7_9GLOM|nr:12670_t:CDS:2 [Cetraspora pellucida]